MVTQEHIIELQKRCSLLLESGKAFFVKAEGDIDWDNYSLPPKRASEETLGLIETLRGEVRNLTARLIDAAKKSPLIRQEDTNDAITAMKIALAALRFKEYRKWDTHVLHDEDVVLGVQQAGQEEYDTDSGTAREHFIDAVQQLIDFADLLVPGSSTTITGEDDRFARVAVEEARKSSSEDERAHPLVGVVVVKDGRILATAHRGELKANHAEYIALEKKLEGVSIAGSTVYTTLEPCTTRNHPKIPCADRLIERKVARVVIGTLDPNPEIRGRGMWKLQQANIAVELFSHELTLEIQELNRQFIRSCLEADKAATHLSTHHSETREIVLQKRRLFNLLRGINCIECDFRFPPGPTGAVFNYSTIRQINADLDGIQNSLIELLDLPKAQALIAARIPLPPSVDASWSWLESTFKEHFLPIQNVFAALKAEVLSKT